MALGFQETELTCASDGTAITAASRTSMTVGATGTRGSLAANKLCRVGDMIRITAAGRISCVVTTPGTARFDLAFGGTANFDTLAMNLNIVAKTNVGWWLDVIGTVRATGTAGNILWQGTWTSEAVIASPLPTVGGSGTFVVPYNTAPAVAANFDMTVLQQVDLYFTQTVATGSCQLHNLNVSVLTATGY